MRILISIVANAVALFATAYVVPGITFAGSWVQLLVAGAIFGLLNLIVRPIALLLSLPALVLTLGLFYFVLNVAMLALAEWIAPDFTIDGFWTYVGAVIVMWLVNVAVGRLLRAIQGDELG